MPIRLSEESFYCAEDKGMAGGCGEGLGTEVVELPIEAFYGLLRELRCVEITPSCSMQAMSEGEVPKAH